jgi:hypothetical protein
MQACVKDLILNMERDTDAGASTHAITPAYNNELHSSLHGLFAS